MLKTKLFSSVGSLSTRQIQLHYEFLVECLFTPRLNTSLIASPQWSWDIFIGIASRELVLPSLLDRFESKHVDLPGEIQEILLSAKHFNLERNKVVLEEVAEVARLANLVGIEPVILKGSAHLLSGLYPAVADRFLFDIDILVESYAAATLQRRLIESGFLPDPRSCVGVDCHHLSPLQRPGRPVVEIHKGLGLDPRIRRFLPAAEVIKNSALISTDGNALRVPCPEHALLHQILHSQLGNSYACAIRPNLRDIEDCMLLMARVDACGRLNQVLFDHLERAKPIVLHLTAMEEITKKTFLAHPQAMHSALLRFEAVHRQLLRKAPFLRLLDPLYLLRSGVLPRARRLKNLMSTDGGLRYILTSPFRISFYENLLREL